MRLKLSICLLFISLGISAQIPGYLGKKFIIQADASFIPSIYGPTSNNYGRYNTFGNQEGRIGASYRVGGKIGYTISRRHHLYLAGDYLKTGMILNDVRTPSLSNNDFEFDFHNLFYNLKGVSVIFGTRFFKPDKGGLSPMGPYFGVNLQATFLKGNIIDKQTFFAEFNPENGHRPLGIDPSYTYIAAGYELGYHHIIANRVILDLGMQVNVPLNVFHLSRLGRQSTFFDENSSSYEEQNQEDFTDAAFRRMALHSLVMIKIGVGFLIF